MLSEFVEPAVVNLDHLVALKEGMEKAGADQVEVTVVDAVPSHILSNLLMQYAKDLLDEGDEERGVDDLYLVKVVARTGNGMEEAYGLVADGYGVAITDSRNTLDLVMAAVMAFKDLEVDRAFFVNKLGGE